MGSPPRIVYFPHPNVTPETEVEVLANIYRFAIRAYEERKAAEKHDGDEGGEGAEAIEHGRTEGILSEEGSP